VALLTAILLAFLVLPAGWDYAAVAAGAAIEVGEAWFWLRWNRRRRSVVGAESLIGREAVVVTPTQVKLDGELWAARADGRLVLGDRVRVRAVEGLTLVVERESV
jgi:membrane protein implicated in regulation of membrane protease activity